MGLWSTAERQRLLAVLMEKRRLTETIVKTRCKQLSVKRTLWSTSSATSQAIVHRIDVHKVQKPWKRYLFQNKWSESRTMAPTIIQEYHREAGTTKLNVAAATPQASPSDVNEYQVAGNLGSSRSNCDCVCWAYFWIHQKTQLDVRLWKSSWVYWELE